MIFLILEHQYKMLVLRARHGILFMPQRLIYALPLSRVKNPRSHIYDNYRSDDRYYKFQFARSALSPGSDKKTDECTRV